MFRNLLCPCTDANTDKLNMKISQPYYPSIKNSHLMKLQSPKAADSIDHSKHGNVQNIYTNISCYSWMLHIGFIFLTNVWLPRNDHKLLKAKRQPNTQCLICDTVNISNETIIISSFEVRDIKLSFLVSANWYRINS